MSVHAKQVETMAQNKVRCLGTAGVCGGLLVLFTCLLSLVCGCAGTRAAGHQAGRLDTELRGVLEMATTNVPTGVMAVLYSRSGTRAPCFLRAANAAVAEDLQIFAAKGTVVIVAGVPGEEKFTVTAVWPDGKRRRKGYGDEDDNRKTNAWPSITWESVPAHDR